MADQIVTRQQPRHPFGAEPRHELVNRPDFAELRLCGHIFEDEQGERICILPAEAHENQRSQTDAERVRILGFALQQIANLVEDVDLKSNLEIYRLASEALKAAGEKP